jgi:hypothetical protein
MCPDADFRSFSERKTWIDVNVRQGELFVAQEWRIVDLFDRITVIFIFYLGVFRAPNDPS